MQTITTQYSIADEILFVDRMTDKILRGTVDKIYITEFMDTSNSPKTNISYLIKCGDGLFYAATEDLMAEDTIELLNIIEPTIDTSLC